MKTWTKKIVSIVMTTLFALSMYGCDSGKTIYQYDDGGKETVSIELLQYCTADGLYAENVSDDAVIIEDRYYEVIESLSSEVFAEFNADMEKETMDLTYAQKYEELLLFPLRQAVCITYADNSFTLMSWGDVVHSYEDVEGNPIKLRDIEGSICEYDAEGKPIKRLNLFGDCDYCMIVSANYFDAKIGYKWIEIDYKSGYYLQLSDGMVIEREVL